jgi:hypothetical protein
MTIAKLLLRPRQWSRPTRARSRRCTPRRRVAACAHANPLLPPGECLTVPTVALAKHLTRVVGTRVELQLLR